MRFRRLTAATLALSALVFGGSVLVANSSAQASSSLTYVCSAADKQLIDTVSSNMVQLGYWSDALTSHDVAPAVVVKQANAEAAQIGATRPTDRTLHAARDLLRSMLLEYGKAVQATMHGHDGHAHLSTAWRLAGMVHGLLAGAKEPLGERGCDVTPLLTS